MGILSLILLAIIITSVFIGFFYYKNVSKHSDKIIQLNYAIKSMSLFALVFGIFGQLIGLFAAFRAVKIGSVEVSPAMMMQGFEVSMITSIYGALIFSIGYVLYKRFKTILKLPVA